MVIIYISYRKKLEFRAFKQFTWPVKCIINLFIHLLKISSVANVLPCCENKRLVREEDLKCKYMTCDQGKIKYMHQV